MVAKLISPYRSASNFVGGGAALNRQWGRISDDLDIYIEDRALPRSAQVEIAALRDAGYSVDILVENDATVEAVVKRYGFETRIQWMDDPEVSTRFFPASLDEEFGYRLHEADNAVNKTLCSARRSQAPRDAVDLITIVREYAPLGPLVWAVCGKDRELTPTKVIQQIRKNAFGYSDAELRTVRTRDEQTITRASLRSLLDAALDAAADYCDDTAPDDFVGCLFLNAKELPVEATKQQVTNGEVSVRHPKQFRALPKFSGA